MSWEMMGSTCCAQIPMESHAVPPAYPAQGTAAEDVHFSSPFCQALARAPSAQLLWEANPSQSGFS